MFPDRATLYVVAIEDRQYKDFKIHCKYSVTPIHNIIDMQTRVCVSLIEQKI